MRKFQILLFVIWSILLIITVRAFSATNIFQAAVEFYTAHGWQAQFNFDFQVYLIFGALWIFYREYTPLRSYCFSFLALLAGNLFFIPYLLYLNFKTKGNIKEMLLGKHWRDCHETRSERNIPNTRR